MERRFFVTVHAADSRAFGGLGDFHFDFIHGPTKRTESGGSMDGLLSVDEVLTLVDKGYEVTIHEPAERRSRALDIVPFDEWLKGV